MKSLPVLVLWCLCCVNAYRIFPLPGQNVESNPKFGKLGLSSGSTDLAMKAQEDNSRLTSFTPLSSFSVESGTQSQNSTPQVRTAFGNFARPLSTAQSVPSTFQTLNDAAISATIQKSSSEGSNQKSVTIIPAVKNTIGNVLRPLNSTQTIPSSSQTMTAVKILNRPSSNNQASTFIESFAVEPPAQNLLPPKEEFKPGLPTNVISHTVPPRPIVEAPFTDLLPPKTS